VTCQAQNVGGSAAPTSLWQRQRQRHGHFDQQWQRAKGTFWAWNCVLSLAYPGHNKLFGKLTPPRQSAKMLVVVGAVVVVWQEWWQWQHSSGVTQVWSAISEARQIQLIAHKYSAWCVQYTKYVNIYKRPLLLTTVVIFTSEVNVRNNKQQTCLVVGWETCRCTMQSQDTCCSENHCNHSPRTREHPIYIIIIIIITATTPARTTSSHEGRRHLSRNCHMSSVVNQLTKSKHWKHQTLINNNTNTSVNYVLVQDCLVFLVGVSSVNWALVFYHAAGSWHSPSICSRLSLSIFCCSFHFLILCW